MDFSTIKGVTLPGNLEVKKMQHGNDVLWESASGFRDIELSYSRSEATIYNPNNEQVTVYYTTDGTTPTSSSTSITINGKESGEIVNKRFDTDITLKCYATDGTNQGEIKTLTMTPDYFWIQNNSATENILFKGCGYGASATIQYSYDKITWTTVSGSSNSTTTLITIPPLAKVYCKTNNGAGAYIVSWTSGSRAYSCYQITGGENKCSIGGNILSVNRTNASSHIHRTACSTFSGSTAIKDASGLRWGFDDSFNDSSWNYSTTSSISYLMLNVGGFFLGCSSLTELPELPATTVPINAYPNMFANCTSLVDASSLVLPATVAKGNTNQYNSRGCYEGMFSGCTSLTSAPALPATSLGYCCYRNMFANCTSLTRAPELPAMLLSSYCYNSMFYNCSSLNYIKAMFTTTPGTSYTNNWVSGVAATGTFVQNDEATWNVSGVSGIPSGWTVVNDRLIPLYIEDASGSENTLSISKGYTDAPSITVQISENNSTWTTLGTTSDTPLTYTIPANGRVYLRATANQWATSSSNYNFINCSSSFNAGGNIMSLLYGSNYSSQTSFGTYQYVFERLFGVVSKCKIVSAEKLVLPSTTITYECYGRMFMGSDLEKAPKKLPATSLGANYCYSYMFADCKNLTTVPTLPATTLKLQCYSYMFRGCTSLVEVPDNLLPATTLQQLCYTNMFSGCTSLERAPKLPATTLANACYQQMFYNCKKLNYIKAMFTTTPSTTYTNSWVNGVAATGTFVKNSSATWNVTGVNGIPSGWTVQTAAS